ncbi:unnamed protein product, partial [Ectocarpus sp. 12 AP-2014]
QKHVRFEVLVLKQTSADGPTRHFWGKWSESLPRRQRQRELQVCPRHDRNFVHVVILREQLV